MERNDLRNPLWIEHELLTKSTYSSLTTVETTFWKEFIEEYLKPLEATKDDLAKKAESLKELRNQMVYSFFMLNAMFIVVVFLLQQQKDLIFIRWPFSAKANVSYTGTPNNPVVEVEYEYLQLEPIGLVFILFFAVVLIVQLIGMIYHRLETIMHIISTTIIPFCNKTQEDTTGEGQIRKKASQITKAIQRAPSNSSQGLPMDYDDNSGNEDDEDDETVENDLRNRRVTLANLVANRNKEENRKESYNLEKEFEKKWRNIGK